MERREFIKLLAAAAGLTAVGGGGLAWELSKAIAAQAPEESIKNNEFDSLIDNQPSQSPTPQLAQETVKTVEPTTATTPEVTATLKPTEIPTLMREYLLGNQGKEIDLTNQQPLTMVFRYNDGTIRKSRPAIPVTEDVDKGDANFYNLAKNYCSSTWNEEGGLITWMHSGWDPNGNPLAMTSLEKDVRIYWDTKGNGARRTHLEAENFLESMVWNSRSIIAQNANGGVLPEMGVDPKEVAAYLQAFPGNELLYSIDGVALIDRRIVATDYTQNARRTGLWIQESVLANNLLQGAIWQRGFESFDPKQHWTIKTCLGGLADEPDKIDYHRLVLLIRPLQSI